MWPRTWRNRAWVALALFVCGCACVGMGQASVSRHPSATPRATITRTVYRPTPGPSVTVTRTVKVSPIPESCQRMLNYNLQLFDAFDKFVAAYGNFKLQVNMVSVGLQDHDVSIINRAETVLAEQDKSGAESLDTVLELYTSAQKSDQQCKEDSQ